MYVPVRVSKKKIVVAVDGWEGFKVGNNARGGGIIFYVGDITVTFTPSSSLVSSDSGTRVPPKCPIYNAPG